MPALEGRRAGRINSDWIRVEVSFHGQKWLKAHRGASGIGETGAWETERRRQGPKKKTASRWEEILLAFYKGPVGAAREVRQFPVLQLFAAAAAFAAHVAGRAMSIDPGRSRWEAHRRFAHYLICSCRRWFSRGYPFPVARKTSLNLPNANLLFCLHG